MQVTVTIGGEEQKFEGGTIAGLWRIEAVQNGITGRDATVAFEYEGVDPTTTWDMPEGQTYTIRGMRLSDTGDELGAPVELGYTVGEDLATIEVAGSLSVKATPPS